MPGRKRKRVEDESESTDASTSLSEDDYSEDKRKKKRRRKSHKRRKYYDSSSGSESSSSSEVRKKKSDRKKKKSKRKKKKKKKKKRKKEKKKRKRELFGTNKIKKITYEFGKHGFLTEAEKYTKVGEFTIWLLDEQNIHRDRISRREEQIMWKKFMEEFNTSTFSHEKYYDLEKWEKKNSTRLNDKKQKQDVWMPTNDDEILRLERKNKRARAEYTAQTQRLQHWTRELKKLKAEGADEFKALNRKHMGDREKSTLESLARKRQKEKTRGMRYADDEGHYQM